jgi:hypothetical protein
VTVLRAPAISLDRWGVGHVLARAADEPKETP